MIDVRCAAFRLLAGLTVLRQLLPNPRFYGWTIVAISFLASALSSPGQSFAISLYIDVLIESLQISRLEVSSLYGAMTLLAAFCLPYVGSLADRTSTRDRSSDK